MATIPETNPKSTNTADLTPVLSARWALKPRHFVVCVLFCVGFVFISSLPLLDWTVWRHLGVGRWIMAHGNLPLDDPTRPLGEAVRYMDGNWLSQLALAWAYRVGGPQGVANLLTALVIGYLAVLARVVYRQTGGVWLMLIGVMLSLLISAGFGLFALADVFGKLCFVLLFLLLLAVPKLSRTHPHTRKTRRTVQFLRHTVPFMQSCTRDSSQRGGGSRWWVAPALTWLAAAMLFWTWANTHGSYLLGIAVLVCFAVAYGGEVVWQLRSLRLAAADDVLRAYVVLAATAIVASLLNPYGWELMRANLSSFGETVAIPSPAWVGVDLDGLRGIVFFGSLGLLAILLLADWPQISATDVLLPAGFAAAVLMTPQAQSWYALVYVFIAMPHLAHFVGQGRWWGATLFGKAVLPPQRRRKRSVTIRRSIAELGRATLPDQRFLDTSSEESNLTAMNFLFTLLSGLAVYCAFCFAPGTQVLMGGSPRPLADLIGSNEAAFATEWLREHAPNARVFALPRWADLLVGLGGDDVTAMMTSRGRDVPQETWIDYGGVAIAAEGWEATLDHYSVDILVLSPKEHDSLIQAVKLSHGWTAAHKAPSLFIARRLGR